MSRGVAPSAIRTPISLLRCSTRYDRTLNRPETVSARARPPRMTAIQKTTSSTAASSPRHHPHRRDLAEGGIDLRERVQQRAPRRIGIAVHAQDERRFRLLRRGRQIDARVGEVEHLECAAHVADDADHGEELRGNPRVLPPPSSRHRTRRRAESSARARRRSARSAAQPHRRSPPQRRRGCAPRGAKRRPRSTLMPSRSKYSGETSLHPTPTVVSPARGVDGRAAVHRLRPRGGHRCNRRMLLDGVQQRGTCRLRDPARRRPCRRPERRHPRWPRSTCCGETRRRRRAEARTP